MFDNGGLLLFYGDIEKLQNACVILNTDSIMNEELVFRILDTPKGRKLNENKDKVSIYWGGISKADGSNFEIRGFYIEE